MVAAVDRKLGKMLAWLLLFFVRDLVPACVFCQDAVSHWQTRHFAELAAATEPDLEEEAGHAELAAVEDQTLRKRLVMQLVGPGLPLTSLGCL